MAPVARKPHPHSMSSILVNQKPTYAFYVQSAISFGISVSGLLLGIAYLPVGAWSRSFLAVGVLYAVTSTFTLAKVVRDQHESSSVLHRVDEARLQRLLAEHDTLVPQT